MKDLIRQFILESIEAEEIEKNSSAKNLLTEPDYSTDDDEDAANEMSVCGGGVGGVTIPLGTESTYPNTKMQKMFSKKKPKKK